MLKQFKKLPQGYYRLLMVGWIVLPLLAASIAASNSDDDATFGAVFLPSIPLYYVLARFGVWIYDGFNENKK